jgi:hypothetical protein
VPAPKPAATTKAPAPKADSCPNGDYSGSKYDGKCGTKPATKADSCPNGDYSGSRTDGKCGTKPVVTPPPAPPSCTEGNIITRYSQDGTTVIKKICRNGVYVPYTG